MRAPVSLSVGLIFVVGCSDGIQPLTPEASFLRADLSGAVHEEHSGEATFASRYHLRHERDVFSVASRDSASRGESDRWISFMAFGSRELPEGVPVELAPIDPHYPARNGETAVYFRDGEWYISHEGTWAVESLSDELITGTFQFRAFRYCVKAEDDACAVPETVPEDAPWIEVRGEFLARGNQTLVLWPGDGT